MEEIKRDTACTDGSADALLHPLTTDVEPPERFTWPFCYEPHPLCTMAAAEVQKHICEAGEWREEADRGKMFGVLVVRRDDGRMAFLAAYSGLLGGRCDLPWFVPPVFDSQQPDGYFKTREAEISAINRRITAMESDRHTVALRQRLDNIRQEAERETAAWRATMAEAKRRRDLLRAQGTADEKALTAESQYQKAELRRLRHRYAELTERAEAELKEACGAIDGLKQRRRSMSDALQRWLFDQYVVLSAQGERRSLVSIFDEATGHIPPSGAGDCCAPKLLQYAFANGLHPLCMAEFWWGASPANELRRHLHYYPACRGKCKPILGHMLRGLTTDPDPLADEAETDGLTIVYEDSAIGVVCKPAGMLSVPGKGGRRSVLSLLRARWPEADGPLIVHRLDMDTSGLLVVAKTMAAYINLQAQFASRTVRKRYVALLAGCIADTTAASIHPLPSPILPPPSSLSHQPSSLSHQPSSFLPPPSTLSHPPSPISLPLRPDPLDRPRQVVDREHGRQAVTEYRITGTDGHGHTRIELHPLTGRTHQLRVHCAHPEGLNMPILGDNLYGQPDRRLYLHAESISFVHPVTGRTMTFESKAPF